MKHITNSEAAWLALAILIPIILYLLSNAYQTRQRMSVRKAIIDKFSTAADFAAFVQSPSGQKFVEDLSAQESPTRAVLGGLEKGIVLIILGGAVWWVGKGLEQAVEVVVVGVLLAWAGVAILISTAISYRLSKRWGLIDRP
ncbi:MAG TPA: hypothetical protein VKU19_24345 [Bryobacteraceae bacterium]|nr:hypothetical protein [Bryobacteraceae bacterium]